MEYRKQPLEYDEQINLLINRGMVINDKSQAVSFLKNISYFRLSAYFLPFKQNNNYLPKTSFNDVISLYSFDQQLRMLILEAMEPIEISFRSKIIYHLSHKYGPFGYLESKNFSQRFNHIEWLRYLREILNNSSETFIFHFQNKYKSNAHLPLWMALEVVSFGSLSRFFKGLKSEDQQVLAKQFGLNDIVFQSWLHILVYIRNLCAHHARLWNRTLTFKPKLPIKDPLWSNIKNNRVYCLLSIIQYLLFYINSESGWKNKLSNLISKASQNLPKVMGFSNNWVLDPLWANLQRYKDKDPNKIIYEMT